MGGLANDLDGNCVVGYKMRCEVDCAACAGAQRFMQKISAINIMTLFIVCRWDEWCRGCHYYVYQMKLER